MGDSTGISGGESTPIKPTSTGGPEGISGEPSGGSIEAALKTPVSSLSQLKQVLVSNLGEKDGTKLYNTFMKSFLMQILNQMRESASQAQKAAQQMRQGPQL